MNNNFYDERQIELRNAMAKVKSAVGAVAKTETAKSGNFGYKYADLYGVTTALLPFLEINNLTISHEVRYDVATQQHLLHTIVSHNNGAFRESIINLDKILEHSKENKKSNNILHEVGGMITYFKRYMILGLFDIPTEDDDGATTNVNTYAQKTYNAQNEQDVLKTKALCTELKTLCEERNISVVEFSKMHGISSNKLHTVEKGLANFEAFAQAYEAKYVQAAN